MDSSDWAGSLLSHLLLFTGGFCLGRALVLFSYGCVDVWVKEKKRKQIRESFKQRK